MGFLFLYHFLFFFAVWCAMDKWYFRREIYWWENMVVGYFFSLINFAWQVEGGWIMTLYTAPVWSFLLGIGTFKLLNSKFFHRTRNNTPEAKHHRVWDGLE